MASDKPDYKDTLNLPSTPFPMKGDLAKREPEHLARWASEGLYQRILDARAASSAPVWVFHDGPPYANGNIHYGHILNKILKDVVVKSRTMMGYRVEFKPGWDTHGLPIELAVMRDLGSKGRDLGPVEIRKACHAYATKWVATQREEFKRLGVFGTWETPYLTLDPSYEATILRQLAQFAELGLLYRDRKPVHWCTSCRTALAEAEIEYDEKHVSPSVYVKFQLQEGLFAVIWTTTPWTLPANHAIAYNPTFDYVTVAARGERYLVAAKLADAFVKANALEETGPRESFDLKAFVKSTPAARHPFLDRASRLLPGDHVTLEQGTGLVHTAPGHGADDFVLGKKYGLPIDAPVDDAGRFTEHQWKGERVFDANPKIVEALAAGNALVGSSKVTHAYPICWRCKNPVIFRATWQWFATIDGEFGLRARALREIGKTTWIPPWGENRIRGMIENRPDWVLSRQRVWGVPIPVLYDESGAPILDVGLMRHVADLVEKEGVDAWFNRDARDLVPPGPAYDALRTRTLTKGGDIVDVWFESGVSWAAVCEGRPGLDGGRPDDPRPVDLYLEGSDQHRGWFHSALLTSAATRDRAPYRAVLTHGFVLDERGRPYSKSEIEKAKREGIKIEFIPPDEVLKTSGAEIFRMWTASADFRGDIAYSRGHLAQLGESYRKVRNTARFLLGNLADHDPISDDHAAITDALDRWLLGRIGDFNRRVLAAYEAYELHVVMRALVDLCAGELSSLYLDVRKDRLYCDPRESPARRQTQAVLYAALRAITLAMAPVLCFTAEEIWSHLRRRPGDPGSIHEAVWSHEPALPASATGDDEEMASLLEWRQRVQKALEPFRAQKRSNLDAQITLHADDGPLLRRSAEWLADFFIVSQVTILPGAGEILVEQAAGHKCERCWKWVPESPLCARCRAAVDGSK